MKKGKILGLLTVLLLSLTAGQRQHHVENLVIVTLDGMRWQEIFSGADSAILFNEKYTRNSKGVAEDFWDSNAMARRQKLMPFFWSVIAGEGQLHGNRLLGSHCDVANPYRFSYPGYNELYTGYPDTAINSNEKIRNHNTTVLEQLNRQPAFTGKVAVFGTWDVFPYIFNKWRSNIYVNADGDSIMHPTGSSSLLNDIQLLSSKPIDTRLDIVTYLAAREYLKAKQPRVLSIGFDETDDYAHKGDYEQYLKSAHAADAMIANLWSTLQSMQQYRDKTALLITCDHGRGDIDKNNWVDHGDDIPESGQTWIAMLGPGISPTGEANQQEQLYQKQVAPTIALLLGTSAHFTTQVSPLNLAPTPNNRPLVRFYTPHILAGRK